MTVTKFFYIFLLASSLLLYSCESNDNIVIQDTKDSAVINKTLVELFTNVSCVPCVPANVFLDSIHHLKGYTYNDTNVIIIRYHSTVFANDPFYNFNPAPNFARQQYYYAITNPKGYLMGKDMGGFEVIKWTNSINQVLSAKNSLEISFTSSYDTASRDGSLNIQIKEVGGTTQTDLVLHIAITENDIPYNAVNGETIFDNTLRDLITGTNGEPISISSGQTLNINHNFSLMTGINANNSDIIIFVQKTSTKEVFGVTKNKLL